MTVGSERDGAPTRRIHVMLLTTGLGIGGAEIVVRDLARTVDRDRFHICICCLKTLGPIGRELADEGLDIFTLPGADANRVDYFSALTLRRIIRDRAVDVVHSHTTHALMDAAICRALSPRLRVVHTFHFGNYPHKPSRDLWMDRIGSRLCDRLIAVGNAQQQQIVAAFRMASSRVSVIRNGVQNVDVKDGDPGFRSRIGADGKVLVGTIGTLIPQKGLFDLLEAARRVRDRCPDVHFVVVGEGVLRAELERKRAELGLDNVVTFTGWLSNAASLALPAFDIYCQPSLWEAMSISILEAMGAAKPVVTTEVGEAPHLIVHGEDGFLVKPRDVDAMAAELLALAGDAARRRAVGLAAADKVRGAFTVGHMARAYERVYEELVSL